MSMPALSVLDQSFLNVFPNEIILQFISFCDISSQVALCRVCQLFQQLAVPWLYQTVELDDHPSRNTIRLFVSSTSISGHQQYTVFLSIKTDHTKQEETEHAINCILLKTTGLRGLRLTRNWIGDFHLPPAFETSSFPHLRILDFGLSPTEIQWCQEGPSLGSFINRHPSISHLALPRTPLALPSAQLTPINLPNLILYSGPITSLDRLENTDKLQSVKLDVNINDSEWDVLARFPACQDVHLIFPEPMEEVEEIQDIFRILKQLFPDLKSLSLIHTGFCLRARVRELLDSLLAEELVGFNQLESFGFGANLFDEMNHPDFHPPIIASWVEACPTLQAVSIFLRGWDDPEGRYKIVDKKAEPTSEPCRLEKLFTHTNWLATEHIISTQYSFQ
ncbi:hypothetical protein C8J56DRAFT_29602 [Mycena floridula]|nr:hypothetical protein C8J56DRAFT_29602 [Mycena floridula]